MRNFLFAVGASVVALLLLGVTANRPQSDAILFLKLNGEPRRWAMSDGGQSGMFGSGVQCMNVTGGDVLKMTPLADVLICVPEIDGGWDGGCSTTATDIHYGDPAPANNPYYLVLQDSTPRVCMVPVTGSANVPAFKMY